MITLADRRLNEKGQTLLGGLQFAFNTTFDYIDRIITPSRQRSIALTNLEQAFLWAVAAIHEDPANVESLISSAK